MMKIVSPYQCTHRLNMLKRIPVMATVLTISTIASSLLGRTVIAFSTCTRPHHAQHLQTQRLAFAFLSSDRRHWRCRCRTITTTWDTTRLQAKGSSSSDNTSDSRHLISVEQSLKLFHSTSGKKVKFVDATWYHKGNRNGRQEFEQGPRIPNSVYFDMMDIANDNNNDNNNNKNNLRMMLPSKRLFAAAMDAMDIQQSNDIIIYGRNGSYFAPRVWFTFAVAMQHPSRVWLMQGSLQDWQAAGGPVETHPTKVGFYAKDLKNLVNSSSFKYHDVAIPESLDDDDNSNDDDDDDVSLSWLQNTTTSRSVVTLKDIKEIVLLNTQNSDDDDNNDKNNSNNNKKPTTAIILDARGSSFAKGHMPNAIHIPYSSLVLPDNTCRFKPRSELQDIFRKAMSDEKLFRDYDNVNDDDDKGNKTIISLSSSTSSTPIICSCGSGVSACTLYLALLECGRNVTTTTTAPTRIGMYDGSWQEYKLYKDLPKVVDVDNNSNRK